MRLFLKGRLKSIGMVLRDCTGKFLEGRNMRIAGKTPVFEAEVCGVHEAISWVVSAISQPMVIKSDSQLAVDAIQKNSSNHLEIGNILASCRENLRRRNDVLLESKQIR